MAARTERGRSELIAAHMREINWLSMAVAQLYWRLVYEGNRGLADRALLDVAIESSRKAVL